MEWIQLKCYWEKLKAAKLNIFKLWLFVLKGFQNKVFDHSVNYISVTVLMISYKVEQMAETVKQDIVCYLKSVEGKVVIVHTAFFNTSNSIRKTLQHTTSPHNYSLSSYLADALVQDFLLHSQGDLSNTSQGMWLQQTCTLFIQSGVQILTEFTQHAAHWANTSVVRANSSQPNHTRSQLERLGHNHGK